MTHINIPVKWQSMRIRHLTGLCYEWNVFSTGGNNLNDTTNEIDRENESSGGDGYERICSMCHRPESKVDGMVTLPGTVGGMFSMPGEVNICTDCLQKAMNQMNMGAIPGFPGYGNKSGANNASGANNSSGDKKKEDDKENIDTGKDTVVEVVDNVSDGDGEGDKEDESTGEPFDMPGIEFINLASPFSFMPEEMQKRHKVKKKKKKKKEDIPVLDINNLPPPHRIKEKLDEYVMGQDHAKKVISVGVYNHYKRILAMREMEEKMEANDPNVLAGDVEIEKSNMLMLGPTGSGKTYMVKTLAELLKVPLAITDATLLTEAGYIGDDVESVISKLLSNADNDVERAETGIVYIDEIDKLAKKENANQRDVSGESVQQALLKLLEGADVEVPVGASSKNAMVPLTTVNTSNILFICGGAFPGLENVIKRRLTKHGGIGFGSELKDKYDNEGDIFAKVETEDIRGYGLIPEFLGRLPIIYSLSEMNEELLVKILTEPKNAIVKQYKKLFSMDGVELLFEDDALMAIAKKAIKKKTGARALRSILEEIMLDIMYEIPKDDTIGRVTITESYVEGHGSPLIELRGSL